MIDSCRLEEILASDRISQGIPKYCYIMEKFRKVDVSQNKAFREKFREFYQLRRFYSDEFVDGYFKVMEELKNVPDVSFEMAFPKVLGICGTYELSFTSKLVHTINPDTLIWDKIVTGDHFKIKPPYPGAKNRDKACIDRYKQYADSVRVYLASDEGQMIIEAFDKKYNTMSISDVKKIDFVLWQNRKMRSA